MDLKEIRQLIEMMNKNGIAVFKLERENFKITLKTNEAAQGRILAQPPAAAPAVLPAIATTALPPSTQPASETPSPSADTSSSAVLKEIKSPMVGTFYAAPSPDSPPFVKVGQAVTPDTVVCIVEAMKVMNEVKAELSGTIAEVCVENGKPVQFGQVLFRVK